MSSDNSINELEKPVVLTDDYSPASSASAGAGAGASPVKASKVKVVDTLTVLTEFRSDKPNMLSLLVGDTVYVLNKTESGWWDGVIFSQNGTLRGWFPSTHCKSISSANQLNSNNRPQNLSALLRQNLGNNQKSRKNSGVSFASSEHSCQSDQQQSPSNRLQQTSSIDPISQVVNLEKVNLVGAQEVESIFNSTGSSNVPIWTPLSTTEGSIVYYNSELNIYCKELPYIETPELDETTNISIATKEQDPSAFSVVSLPDSQQHRSSIKTRQSTVGYDRKESAAGSTRSRSSLPSNTTTVHPWNTSLYCEPDLFYYDPTDIKTWSGLRDAFMYFLTLTSDALHKKIGVLFYTYFNIASRLAVLIHLSARLAQHDLQKSGYQNRVQRRLKKIASSIAQVGINGNLYLTEPSGERNASTISQDTIKVGQPEEVPTEQPPTDNAQYLHQVETEIDNLRKSAIACVKVFIQISSNQNNDANYLPQVYPRFLTGVFSGGNWRNPFVAEPKDPFAGKEVAKSLHHKRVSKIPLTKETLEKLEGLKEQIKLGFEEALIVIREKENTQARNVDILSKAHKQLHNSSKYIDTIEGLDFSVFLNNRRNSTIGEFDPSKLIYPVLTEFFESKQDLRDITVTLVMEFQNLTLIDPTVFKSIKEDKLDSNDKFANVEPEKTARELEIELLKIDVERDHGISIDSDRSVIETILKGMDLLDISITLVQQLIGEKDALMNYATRVMNDDFHQFEFYNNEREDSAITTDEYQLPASTTNRHITKEVPWYLESEEYNLIFTNNDTIKGGTREALIQRLTHHDLLDAPFNLTFLLTFRSMMKTTTLIELLVKRFNIQPPENLAYEEYTDWVEKKSYPIKLRVVNIMKTLLQKYWVASYNEPKLVKVWGAFINVLLEQNFPGSEQLSKQFQKKVVEGEVSADVNVPENTDYSSKSKKLKLLEIDANELASQLTIRESGMYSKIKQTECLDKSWSNKYSSLGGFQNLQKFISNSNDLTNFITTQIVNHNDIKKRVNLIKYFVKVAEKCRQLNNFSSMTAIISALYSSPVHRLKKTWKSVPAATMNLMHKMNDLMNSSRNFSEYREHLRFISDKPCVPFLGVFLSDLTFTTNGNPDHLHGDPKLVNFAKRAKTVDILREISRYQNLKYNLKKNDDIQDFITSRLKSVMNIDEQYNRSLIIEPRIKVAQQLQSNQHKASVASNSTVTNRYLKPSGTRYFTLVGPGPM